MALAEALRPKAREPRELTGANFDIIAGQSIHRAIGILAGKRPLPVGQHARLIAIIQAAATACEGHTDNTVRGRALLHEAATGAGVYVARFMLGEDWALLGAEVRGQGARVDLAYQHADGTVVIDEIKRGMSRDGHTAVHAQVVRYQRMGAELWGRRFAGVRLLWLASPQLSQLYPTARSNGRLLSEAADSRLRGGFA